MSLQDELLADFASSDESDPELAVPTVDLIATEEVTQALNVDVETYLKQDRELTTQDLLKLVDLGRVSDIKSLSKLQPILEPVLTQIGRYDAEASGTRANFSQEYEFLIKCNDLSSDIIAEIQLIHKHVTLAYSPIFPELETFIQNPVIYSKTVRVLSCDLSSVEDPIKVGELRTFLSGEQVLVLTMAALQQKKQTHNLLNQISTQLIMDICDMVIDLEQTRNTITHYVSSRLSLFAPNITTIVGSYTAAQLISVLGGLKTLAATPSCNIPSLGSNRQIGIGFGNVGVRQKGFLYNCDMVQQFPEDLRKQAMRIISGKLVLAARVDLANSATSAAQSNNSLGVKWRQEIIEKLEKLATPPDDVGVKPLPIPVDTTSKKRGGRRYRKFKEQFAMSDLQKAANRMEFGTMETTVTDAFGRDIGLGMAARHEAGTGRIRKAKAESNNKPKMSKAMAERLK
ncbi:hypothetical protein BABINDRAFT_95284 [Babjeviella inositovora NRRL Y-12698]|uniref:Nop domain-containing protein n=1 Tax=Babjeviella inositovora NRRL Y-12698 TaxID=984486 RepID=A0A1E3QLQ2_9ASCO|nr:uncharacterized protein BABINDRAFT_95284 [Babjeviella inositovora NRRL Y-12698]ODQ77917.1 hypothetical protein BABINDRAFT_95284 [Babjeviella inositovora NRRL Y-12698]